MYLPEDLRKSMLDTPAQSSLSQEVQVLRAPLITALENTDYFLAATAALEVQMFVRMSHFF